METVSIRRIRDVAQAVLSDATQRGLHAGHRLPTERDLADELRLTRSTVRNAMALLESDGVVSREVGRGTYLMVDPDVSVPARPVAPLVRAVTLRNVSPTDVMVARHLIESAAMQVAVAQATEEDIEEMERCLRGRRASLTYDEFERWDLEFHRCLINASHNALLLRMYQVVEVARQSELWGSLKRRGDSLVRREEYNDQHRQIVVALRNRDGRAAYEAMEQHLNAVETNLDMTARV